MLIDKKRVKEGNQSLSTIVVIGIRDYQRYVIDLLEGESLLVNRIKKDEEVNEKEWN